jgi:hypothetical protein
MPLTMTIHAWLKFSVTIFVVWHAHFEDGMSFLFRRVFYKRAPINLFSLETELDGTDPF